MIFMDFLILVILAFIGEAVWETLQLTFKQGKLNVDRLGSLLIGVLVAVATGADIMEMVGVPMKIPYIGVVLTGLLISRGANFTHDILVSISNLKQNTKP